MVLDQQAANSEKCREPDKSGASLHRSFVFLADPPTRDRLSSQHAPGVGSASAFTGTPDSRPARTVTHWFSSVGRNWKL